MNTKILLTSFQTWLPHQRSNSSNDILAEIEKCSFSADISLLFLKKLPVNIELASQKVICEIECQKPDVVVCCGMAEKRDTLTIESNAFCHGHCLFTTVDLAQISKNLKITKISNNAGKFVCEGLYYEVLNYIQFSHKDLRCIFVHVPLLNNSNLELIVKDFYSIILSLQEKLAEF